MSKPYRLRSSTLDKVITKTKSGVYIFGSIRKKGEQYKFFPKYVGRSDSDLNDEIRQQGLHKKVDDNGNPLYRYFVTTQVSKAEF